MRRLSTLAGIVTTAGLIAAMATTAVADPSYIYGLHDQGGEGYMGSNKGWILWTEEIGHDPGNYAGNNYSAWSNAGYGVIVRINNGYGSNGTIPYESQYDNFAQRCANFVNASSGVDYYIIGNETNLPREWPGNNGGDPNTGQPITVARYVSCYNKCYTAIKNVKPAAKLIPVPSGTWAPPYPGQGIEGFLDYWVNILNSIGASKIDGLAIHVYTHGCDPTLITDQAKMGPPYQDIYYNFQVYRNYMAAIPSTMTTKPVLITECDQNIECADYATPRHTWYNVNNGWVRAAYAEINSWNQANSQKIRSLVLFRWIMAWEDGWTFGLQDRDQVLADFQQAVAYGYMWDTGPSNCVGLGPGNPTGSNLSLTAAYCIESGRYNTQQYGRSALDGLPGTSWCCNTAQTGGTATLAVDLGSTSTVTGYIVRHASWGGGSTAMNTKYYRIESASSIFGPWTVEYDVDNSCQDQYNRFIYETPKSLRYVRLVITNPGVDSYVRLPEFEIYGTAGTRGTITVYASDYQGGVNAESGTDYYDTSSGNSGGQYRSHDVDIETCTDGRYNVGWVAAGEWLNFPIQGQGTGVYNLYMRYATPNSGKTCSFKLNGAALTGALSMNNTGGWQAWQTLNCGVVNIGTGWKTIQFCCDSSAFNIQRFWLVPTSSSPAINRSPASLAPSCIVGNNASSQTFTVANSGGGTLSYTISDNVSWLACTPTSGTSTGEADTITVNYSTSGLSAGTYNATITVSDPNASNNPQTVAVTLTVSETPPCENGDLINGGFESGQSPWVTFGSTDGVVNSGYHNIASHGGSKMFGVGCSWQTRNGGAYQQIEVCEGAEVEAAVWIRTDSSGAAWDTNCRIGIDPYGGTDKNSANVLWTEWANSVGQWSQIGLTGANRVTAQNTTITVFIEHWHKWALTYNLTLLDDVQVSISGGGPPPPPAIALNPTSLSPVTQQGSSPAAGSFTVANSGGGTLSYTISDNVSWLACTPTSGTSTGEADTITVNYSTGSLSTGTYNATITVSDPNATNNPQTIAVTLTVSPSKTTVAQDFESMPSWSSSFDAGWGSAASWSIVSGGQSGNALQASRGSEGSSAKVKVYSITAGANYTISVYMKCPSYGGSYWAECAYKLGSYTAEDFDQNGGTWTMVKKFAGDGANGNGNTWTQYSATFNSGSNTQISVGFKLGSSGGAGPTVLWDTLRIQ